MLLTLATSSMHGMRGDPGCPTSLLDVPAFAMGQLSLRGLNVMASDLAGWSLEDLDALRDRADKASCPCLVLVEDTPLPFADPDPDTREKAGDRVGRLATAAHRLGCNALAVKCEGSNDLDTFETTANEVKTVLGTVERLELNLLIAPSDGLTDDPDRLTELLKRIGGFRIGSLPSFAHAAETGDAVVALRKLAPYAGAVHASIMGFTAKGAHQGYDLGACVSAIRSVGFTNTLAIEYRGNKDVLANIERARDALQAAIDSDEE